MNRQQVRSNARAITELTTDDVLDATIDLYAQDGYTQIMNMERRWPTFETSGTLTTVIGDDTYTLTTDFGGIREVSSIQHVDNGNTLDLIGYEDGENAWRNTSTGRPQQYSMWAGQVKLWPSPAAAYSLRWRGYRKPISWWLTDNVEIDADDRLHMAVVYYVVARLYQLQEDVDMSNFYAQTFMQAVRSAHDDIMRPPAQRPLVLNQGVRIWPNGFSRWYQWPL